MNKSEEHEARERSVIRLGIARMKVKSNRSRSTRNIKSESKKQQN